VSKKRRENQENRQPFELKRVHIAIGAAVVLTSAGIAIAVFTVFGGSSISEGKRVLNIPPLGAELPAERGAAADVLANKKWDDMSADERSLVASEANRAYADGTFRASNGLVIGIDVFRSEGHTYITRQYLELADKSKADVAESMVFYCPTPQNDIHAVKYFRSPDNIEMSDAKGGSGDRPWEQIVSNIDWSRVEDFGWATLDGHRLHGFRMGLLSDQTRHGHYWFDVETARLMQRGEELPSQVDNDRALYTLQWREMPELVLPDTEERVDCVADLLAKAAG
jgi:hypothetical protein